MNSMKMAALGTAALTALAVAACSHAGGGPETSLGLAKAKAVTPTGSAFDRALYTEYLALSQSEYDQGDYINSDLYADNARLAAQANPTGPAMPISRRLPTDKLDEITSSYFRLSWVFAGDARTRAPQDSAKAQAMFDCWLEQQEENRQPKDIAACRDGFMAAVAKVEAAMLPTPVVFKPPPEVFTVHFDYNKATLNRSAKIEVAYIVNRSRTLDAKSITVEGFTDRSGSDAYNLRLSQKREAVVHDAIHVAGVNAAITGQAYGEARPATPTADGVREPANRRVVVTVTP